MTNTTPDPDRAQPRRFWLIRRQEDSGTRGSGTVAEGAVWTTGQVTLHWPGQLVVTSHWASLDDLLATHGDRTQATVEWLDGGDDHSECAEYDGGAIWVH